MPVSTYYDPKTNKWLQAQEAAKAGLNVSPEDIPVAVPEVVKQEQVKPTINPIESEYNSYNDPLAPLKNFINPISDFVGNTAKSVGDTASDLYKSASETGSDLYKSASETGRDIGNWADRNRVGLGGFATAIGAGFARRDPSDALANYNKSIIQNKQQRQEEEKFKMATDSNHPYNQQFRELFASMLPDVTAKLGDRFGKMTVQNFKDAGLTDLLDVTQKQIEISKNDPNSPISKRTRDMASSQYGITIPENYSANDVPRFLESWKTKEELANKREEIGIKRDVADTRNREVTDKLANSFINRDKAVTEREALQQKMSQQEQMFEPQLKEQKVKAEVASQTQQDQIKLAKEQTKEKELARRAIDPTSDLSKRSQQLFKKNFPQYGKYVNENSSKYVIEKIINDVIPDLERTKMTTTSAEKRTIAEQNARQKIEGIRQNAANLRVRMQQSGANYRTSQATQLGYARLNETERSNRAREELQNKKLSDKYADTYISEGELGNQGLTKQTISKKLEQGAGARELIRNSNTIMNKIDDVGFKDVAGLTSLSGELQSLYTNIGLDVKQNKALGAYDQGVRDLLSELAKNPTSPSALAKKKMVKGQYKAVIDTINNAYKSKSIQQKWDERVGSPVDYTLKLNRAVKDGDAEAIQEFSELGYGQDDLIKAYKNSMPLKTKGGE